MALQYSGLGLPQLLAASAASILTNAASEKVYIRGIVIHNTLSTAEIVKLWLVPNSGGSLGTAANGNKIFEEEVLAKQTYIIEFPGPGLVMVGTNDSLQGSSDTASSVTVTIIGDKDA